MATLAILSLTALQPDTPFWQEAVRMVFVGLGLGMVMPLMNLAVQNEFQQKDLGSVTATVQLTRGLGSTIGTAVMSGILTTGVAAVIGNANTIPYIQALQKSPEASKLLGTGDISADALLAVNMQKDTIKDGFTASLASQSVPQVVKDKQLQAFSDMQADYNKQVVDAFTKTLHHIFIVSGSLMAVAFVLICFIKERELRGDVHLTPGE